MCFADSQSHPLFKEQENLFLQSRIDPQSLDYFAIVGSQHRANRYLYVDSQCLFCVYVSHWNISFIRCLSRPIQNTNWYEMVFSDIPLCCSQNRTTENHSWLNKLQSHCLYHYKPTIFVLHNDLYILTLSFPVCVCNIKSNLRNNRLRTLFSCMYIFYF